MRDDFVASRKWRKKKIQIKNESEVTSLHSFTKLHLTIYGATDTSPGEGY